MNKLSISAAIVILLISLHACKKDKNPSITDSKIPAKMAGPRLWHGYGSNTSSAVDSYQTLEYTIPPKEYTISIIGDTAIAINTGLNGGLPLAFIKDDKTNNRLEFRHLQSGYYYLYYYYNGDSMHYTNRSGGIHSISQDLFTP